jgi:hypothetical protein
VHTPAQGAVAPAVPAGLRAVTRTLAGVSKLPGAVVSTVHFLIVRGANPPDPDHPDPNLVIVPGFSAAG